MKNVFTLTEQLKNTFVYTLPRGQDKTEVLPAFLKEAEMLDLAYLTLVFCFLVSKSSDLRFEKIYKFSSSFIN